MTAPREEQARPQDAPPRLCRCGHGWTPGNCPNWNCLCVVHQPAPLVRGPGASEGEPMTPRDLWNWMWARCHNFHSDGSMIVTVFDAPDDPPAVAMIREFIARQSLPVPAPVPPPVGAAVHSEGCLLRLSDSVALLVQEPRHCNCQPEAPVGEPAAAAPEPLWKQALEHQIHRTHKHNPGACDACQDAELLLIPDEMPDEAHEKREP